MRFNGQSITARILRATFGAMLLILLAVISNPLFGQLDTNSLRYRLQKNGTTGSHVDLENPVKTEWRYNAKANRYEGFRNLGSLSYATGESMSVAEYFQKQSKIEN